MTSSHRREYGPTETPFCSLLFFGNAKKTAEDTSLYKLSSPKTAARPGPEAVRALSAALFYTSSIQVAKHGSQAILTRKAPRTVHSFTSSIRTIRNGLNSRSMKDTKSSGRWPRMNAIPTVFYHGSITWRFPDRHA